MGHPAVHLDLLFAHAACRTAALATAGAAFAVEVTPHPRHPRQGVLHASQLDLEAGLLGLGALGEDIEDHFLAVDHAHVGGLFPFALLGRGELVVDDDAVALVGLRQFDDLGGLAGAAEEFPVHLTAAGEDLLDHANAQGAHQFTKLFEQGFGFYFFTRVEIQPHQQGALDQQRFLADFKHSDAGLASDGRGC